MKPRTLVLLVFLISLVALALYIDGERHSELPAEGQALIPVPADRTSAEHVRVSDEAGILRPFGPRLGKMTDAFSDDLGIDVHIVTREDASLPIEQQSNLTYKERNIGIDARTGGLLVILNPELGNARIEVSRSLEHALTDLHMSRLARNQLAPYTAYNAAGMVVMDVLHYLRDHVYVSAAVGDLVLEESFRSNPEYLRYGRYASGGAGAKAALSAVPLDADLKRAVPEDKRARYAPSAEIAESVSAFLRVTAELAADPTLELFTEGSRLMRAYYPVARFEELKRVDRIESSRPLEFIQHGDYAVATSYRPANGFVPILLHREEGLWRVDLVETWKNLFFNGEGDYYLRNSNTPYAFGLAQFGSGRSYDLGALQLETESIEDALAALDGRIDALSALRRAEIWLRNAFVFPQAYAAYEAAQRAAPNDPLVLETIASRALYLGFPEIAIPALEQIGRGAELSLAEAYHATGDYAAARYWVDRALDENPYHLHALQWQKYLAENEGRHRDVKSVDRRIAKLSRDPAGPLNPVILSFDPPTPKFEPQETLNVNGTTVYDHSYFRVTMHNTSNRPVEIESVAVTSEGTAAASGLGDIKSYWRYPDDKNRLPGGASISFDKRWGFTVDTGHEHVRYVFRTCWRGVDARERQCQTQWVDVLP